jgi:hypothetical protein
LARFCFFYLLPIPLFCHVFSHFVFKRNHFTQLYYWNLFWISYFLVSKIRYSCSDTFAFTCLYHCPFFLIYKKTNSSNPDTKTLIETSKSLKVANFFSSIVMAII